MRASNTIGAAGLALGLGLATGAAAQVDLFSNHGPDASTPALATGATTASGVLAPPGAMWSEVQRPASGNAGGVAGFSSHLLDGVGAYRFADDFVVPPGGWRLTSVLVYAYQSGFEGPLAPSESLNVRIWSGRPGDGESEIVFGDDTTNRLEGAEATDVYRVFSTTATPEPAAPDTTRRLWAGVGALEGVFLTEGTYWIDWQHVSTEPEREIFSTPATIVGARGAPGANARQFAPAPGGAEGRWRDVIDAGKPAAAADSPQDMAFVLRGFAGPACPADWNGDGVSNSTDVSEFVNDWFVDQAQGTLETDFNHDGVSNSTDVSEFVNAWFTDQASGCGG